ncbi:MAG: hypothetical protein Q4P06_08060 [Actinomycetaceae bacterium]|nr:hypothetical protein [Actinomycetaceae bacterium]
MSNDRTPPTYGNWRVPRAAGLGKLSFGTSVSLIVGLVIAVLAAMTGGLAKAALVLVFVGFMVVSFSVKDKHQLSIADRVKEKAMWWRRKRKGTHFRSGGLAPRDTGGAFELPGVLRKVKVTAHRDPYDREFALVEHASGTVAVVMSASPDGYALVDPEVIDMQVARWGVWLANLSDETGIVGAAVTVETAPDSGDRLRREVAATISDTAPDVAKQMLSEAVNTYPRGAAQVRAWVTLTFDPTRMGARGRGGDAIAREIGTRLPSLLQSLSQTGAGGIHLVTVSELARIVRVAFDPASETLFEQAAVEGTQVALDWTQVGPGYAKMNFESYEHDSAVSKSWTMSVAPRGNVQSSILGKLVSPQRDVARKRVTLLYKPIPSARAVNIVDRDLAQASAAASSATASARAKAERRAAQQVADEEAQGASLIDFTMIVTATARRGEDLGELSATVDALSSTARLVMRTAYGAQDTAFAMGLPLGLRPHTDSALSQVSGLM